jgi:O-antigen/teichoic acid export membrane protein
MLSGVNRTTNSLLKLIGLEREDLSSKFGQDVLWNIASYVVMAGSGIAINVIIWYVYSPNVLGVFNQVFAVYVIASQFAVAGIHLSVVKYVAQYSAQKTIYRAINTSAILLSIIISGLSAILILLLSEQIGRFLNSPQVTRGIVYIAPALFFFSINKVLLSILNGLSRMKLYALFQALRYTLIVVALISIIVSGVPSSSLPFAFTIAEGILLICLIISLYKEFLKPSFAVLREWILKNLEFGIKGVGSNVLLQMNTRVDVLVLGYYMTDYYVGIYSFVAIFIEGIYQLLIILRTVYNPLLVRLISDQKIEQLKAVVKRGSRITYRFMIIGGVIAVLLYPLGVLVSEEAQLYLRSWPIFTILMTGIVLSSGYIPFGQILVQAGRPGLHTIMTLLLVAFNFTFNLLLIPFLGIVGAAAATAFAHVVGVILLKVFTKQILHIWI